MTNINIVAVALLTGVSAVLIADEAAVSGDVIKKAEEEGINILRTKMTAFDASAAVGNVIDMRVKNG